MIKPIERLHEREKKRLAHEELLENIERMSDALEELKRKPGSFWHDMHDMRYVERYPVRTKRPEEREPITWRNWFCDIFVVLAGIATAFAISKIFTSSFIP